MDESIEQDDGAAKVQATNNESTEESSTDFRLPVNPDRPPSPLSTQVVPLTNSDKNSAVVSIRESRNFDLKSSRRSSRRNSRRRGSVHAAAMRSVVKIAKLARKKREDDHSDEDDVAEQNAKHDKIIDSFKIRSLRSAEFFAGQESGGQNVSEEEKVPFRIPLVSIKSKFRIRWDSFVMIFVLFTSFQVPYEAAFQERGASPYWLQVVTTLIDILFVLDLLLNMRTTFIDEDHVEVVDEHEILIHYLTGFFCVDLLSTIPLDSIFAGPTSSLSLLNSLKMIRLLRLGRLLKKLDDVTAAGVLRLGRIVLGIFLLLHWLACGMKLLIDGEDRSKFWDVWGDTHVDKRLKGSSIELYFVYFYSTTAMVFRSIDSHPKTGIERAFVSLVIIFGAMLQGVLFGSVAVLISSFDKASVEYQQQTFEVLGRLKQLGVPASIQSRAKRFLDLRWVHQRSSKVDVDHYVKLFSPVLSTEIKLSLYLKRVTDTPFFKECGREVLIALVNTVNTQVYLPGDAIIRKGEFGDWMAFIGKGSVSVLVPDKNNPTEEKEVAILRDGPGGFFGEMSLLFYKARNATIQARTWTRIHQLFRKDFERVFAKYPDEKIAMSNRINGLKLFKTKEIK